MTCFLIPTNYEVKQETRYFFDQEKRKEIEKKKRIEMALKCRCISTGNTNKVKTVKSEV